MSDNFFNYRSEDRYLDVFEFKEGRKLENVDKVDKRGAPAHKKKQFDNVIYKI